MVVVLQRGEAISWTFNELIQNQTYGVMDAFRILSTQYLEKFLSFNWLNTFKPIVWQIPTTFVQSLFNNN